MSLFFRNVSRGWSPYDQEKVIFISACFFFFFTERGIRIYLLLFSSNKEREGFCVLQFAFDFLLQRGVNFVRFSLFRFTDVKVSIFLLLSVLTEGAIVFSPFMKRGGAISALFSRGRFVCVPLSFIEWQGGEVFFMFFFFQEASPFLSNFTERAKFACVSSLPEVRVVCVYFLCPTPRGWRHAPFFLL